jgi:hypothetical protein
MAAFLLALYAFAPTNPAEAGSDTREFHGRYMDTFLAGWLPLANFVGWCVGVFVGASIKAGRSEGRPTTNSS